jgi:hypothetical protein
LPATLPAGEDFRSSRSDGGSFLIFVAIRAIRVIRGSKLPKKISRKSVDTLLHFHVKRALLQDNRENKKSGKNKESVDAFLLF